LSSPQLPLRSKNKKQQLIRRLITIKKILKRSPLLIILFAAVGALFTLYFSGIAEYYYSQAVSWPDFLSGKHVNVYIQQYLPDTENPVRTKDLIDYCKEREDSFIIYRDFPYTSGKAVYLGGNTSFEPDIVEGRSFTKEDFEKQMPVAIIADYEWLSDKCIIRNGKEYILHENNEYEVIGKFKRPSRQYLQEDGLTMYEGVYDASYFVNMAASFETDIFIPLNGYYTIDAKEKSGEFLEGFTNLVKKINPDIRIDREEVIEEAIIVNNTQRLLRAINYEDSMKLLILIILPAFLILLNIPSITNYWIEGRKKEISVRMLSGGKPSAIRNMMLRDYLLITTIGYVFGLLLVIIVANFKLFLFIGVTVYPAAVISGYITCLLIGLILGFISLTIILKKNVIIPTRE